MMLITLLNTNEEMYASTLAKAVDCTYSHVVKVLQEMNKAGLVSFQKRGRLKILTLTKKGKDVSKSLYDVQKTL
ncbi:MAG: winged helix DNA-binding protein [Candidatus Woesearchaeota archaeon]